MDALYSKAAEFVDRQADDYLKFLEKICCFETNSHDKDSINTMIDYILCHEKENKYIIERKSFENAGDTVCIDYARDKSKIITISAHMDTVYNKGDFGYPPVKKDSTYIYGPGVSDCKGGIAVGLLAMSALKSCGYDEANIRFLLQSDEEVGSVISNQETVKYICKKAEGSIAFLNLETKREGHLTFERKGIIRVRFDIEGKSVHSKDVHLGVNAISEAAFKIAEISKASLSKTITFNCGTIIGGTAPNVVPNKCSFEVECRIAKENEYQQVFNFLKKVAEKTYIQGAKTTLTHISSRVPMEYKEKNKQLFVKLNKISKNYGFGELTPKFSFGGSDAAYISQANIPVVDSLGIVGEKYHTIEECAQISSLAQSAKFLVAAILELSKEN